MSHRYRLGRTKIAGIASSRPALIGLTSVLLLLLAFIAGNASYILLDATDWLPSAPPFEEWTYWLTGSVSSALSAQT